MKLFVEKIGFGEPIVLLHGWGFDSNIWRKMVSAMSPHYQFILIDLPGFGQSSLLSSDQLINVCEAVLDVSPSQATYMGWSLGGVVATAIACFYPDRVSRLISVASSPRFLQTDLWPGLTPEILKKFSERLAQDYKKTLEEFIYLQLQGSEDWKNLMIELKKQLLFQPKVPSIDALQASLAILSNTDLRQNLNDIQCPQLYILGQLDALVPVKIAEILSRISPQGIIKILPKAAHVPFVSHQNEFIKILDEFMHE